MFERIAIILYVIKRCLRAIKVGAYLSKRTTKCQINTESISSAILKIKMENVEGLKLESYGYNTLNLIPINMSTIRRRGEYILRRNCRRIEGRKERRTKTEKGRLLSWSMSHLVETEKKISKMSGENGATTRSNSS